MPRIRSVFVMLATIPTLALAQTAPPFLGHWSAKSVSRVSGAALVIDLVLADSGSTWTYTPIGGKENPCFKKSFPVTVIAQTDAEMKLQVDGSKALEGCPDFVVEMKRVDEKTYEAQFVDGRRLNFSRVQ